MHCVTYYVLLILALPNVQHLYCSLILFSSTTDFKIKLFYIIIIIIIDVKKLT